MNDESTISICLAADSKYIWRLVETLWSIRKVSTSRKTDVYVLLDCSTDAMFMELCRELHFLSTKTMTVIPLDAKKVVKMDRTRTSVTKYIPYTSYMRIFFPEIFPGLDKILWLDCDLVVLRPLDELWDTNLDGKYVAAADDFMMERGIVSELRSCGVKRYFNAGVTLFNLAKIRADGMARKCKARMYNSKPRFQDQTVLNECYKENVQWLSPRFNLHYTSCSHKDFARWAHDVFGETYKSSQTNTVPVIAHFTGIGTKPWEKDMGFFYDEYVQNTSEAMQFITSSDPNMFKQLRAMMRVSTRNVKPTYVHPPHYIPPTKDLGRKVNVCLTSYPPRISSLARVVRKFLTQTVRPDRIFVTLSKPEFPHGMDSLPGDMKEVAADPSVTVLWVNENTKTMKKLFPALSRIGRDDIVIIADDDIDYPADLIEKRIDDFYKFGERFAISSNNGSEPVVGLVVSGSGSLMTKRMLTGWRDFVNNEVLKTFEDDWVYTYVMALNRYYFVQCSSHKKTTFNGFGYRPSRCYFTTRTIKVLKKRYNEVKNKWRRNESAPTVSGM